ncbi:hypothetical protein [Rosenbergiella epipactidis]|uniref:hypothetical protein n=1 Tax=Rosenbergiella epipactidis TaxID=1544694 RepID=UPI001F4EF429|nr:hypothetical protein [Rosenbergiella epipactidis]
MGVFVYADESGHSGKKIFNEGPQAYLQGSIISLGDADPILSEVVGNMTEWANENQKLA